MRLRKIVFILLTALSILCLPSSGFANEVTVEIIPLGIYLDSDLPPGEATGKIMYLPSSWGNADKWEDDECFATLEALAYPGWVFMGWQFDKSFLETHQTPSNMAKGEREPGLWDLWRLPAFKISDQVTAKAVFAFVGYRPVKKQYDYDEPFRQEFEKQLAKFPVGVYVRDSRGRDGEFGTVFCYPDAFSKDLSVREGSNILLAALAESGYIFSNWIVYKEDKNGSMSLVDQPTSNVLLLLVDAQFSIDAIFKKFSP